MVGKSATNDENVRPEGLAQGTPSASGSTGVLLRWWDKSLEARSDATSFRVAKTGIVEIMIVDELAVALLWERLDGAVRMFL